MAEYRTSGSVASLGGIAAATDRPPNLRHFSALAGSRAEPAENRAAHGARNNVPDTRGATVTLPHSLLPAVALDAYLVNPGRCPALAERFLPPNEFVWGGFAASDGAVLRWGHLPVPPTIPKPRAACVIAVGFGEFIEKHFETMRDLAARGIAVWCLDWRGQGRSIRPPRLPTRPRARNFSRDAEDLAEFAAAQLPRGPAAPLGGSFDGRRDRAGLPAPLSRPVRRGGVVLANGRAAHRTSCRRPWCAF